MKLSEVQVFVTDLIAADKFYKEALGLTLKSSDDKWRIFDIGVDFVVMGGTKNKQISEAYGSRAASIICFRVNSIEERILNLFELIEN